MVWSGDRLLKLKRSASFAKVAAEPPIGRRARPQAHQAYADGLTDNKPVRTMMIPRRLRRGYLPPFATRAPDCMLETEVSRAVHCDKDVFNCRPYERQAASMSSNFMRRNLGIPHAQGLLLGLHLLAVTSVTLDNIRP